MSWLLCFDFIIERTCLQWGSGVNQISKHIGVLHHANTDSLALLWIIIIHCPWKWSRRSNLLLNISWRKTWLRIKLIGQGGHYPSFHLHKCIFLRNASTATNSICRSPWVSSPHSSLPASFIPKLLPCCSLPEPLVELNYKDGKIRQLFLWHLKIKCQLFSPS